MTPHERARALVLEYGRNATSYQVLNPGIRLWFNRAQSAVAGYVEHHGVRIVAGIPICNPVDLPAAVAELERDAAAAGCDVAYFAVEQMGLALWPADAQHTRIVIGAQPVWHPRTLVETMTRHRSLRAQLNRAAAKRVTVEEWSVQRAQSSIAVRRCLDEWLGARRLPPLHFLVESNTLPRLLDRRVFVAMREGHAIGFLVASPIARRNGWLVEQNIRGAHAPNGTSESLLFKAASALAQDRAEMITLGLSPLSRHAPLSAETPPKSLRALFAWLRVHGRRFYNFEGLDGYKAKFRPETWEPVYAVTGSGLHTWKALIAIGAAFGGTSAVPFVGRVMQHALEQELERVKKWRRRTDG
jgi:phosphatidylglycerol lysyltransferase